MTVIPFLTYKILPSQGIVQEHIRSDHVCFFLSTIKKIKSILYYFVFVIVKG